MTLQKYFIPLQLFFIQNLILECCDIHHPHQIDKEKSHSCDFTKIKKKWNFDKIAGKKLYWGKQNCFSISDKSGTWNKIFG